MLKSDITCNLGNALVAKMEFHDLKIRRKFKVVDMPLDEYIALFSDEMADERLEINRPLLADLAQASGLQNVGVHYLAKKEPRGLLFLLLSYKIII